MKKPAFAILIFLATIWTGACAQAASSSIVVNTQAEIPVSIQLSVNPQGQSELRFGNIQPSASQTTQAGPVAVTVKVQTNTGQKYQVTQAASGPLQNTNGDTINLDNLKFTTSSTKPSATNISSPTSVSSANQTIYISNDPGDEDTISAQYTLTVPASQPAGDYSAFLTYTASSI